MKSAQYTKIFYSHNIGYMCNGNNITIFHIFTLKLMYSVALVSIG